MLRRFPESESEQRKLARNGFGYSVWGEAVGRKWSRTRLAVHEDEVIEAFRLEAAATVAREGDVDFESIVAFRLYEAAARLPVGYNFHLRNLQVLRAEFGHSHVQDEQLIEMAKVHLSPIQRKIVNRQLRKAQTKT